VAARGKSAKGIAQILKISPRIASVHSAAIVRNVGVENRLQAVAIEVRCDFWRGSTERLRAGPASAPGNTPAAALTIPPSRVDTCTASARVFR